MHCQNCSNSVKEAMAKAGANNIVVDLEKKCVSWEGCLTKEQAKEIIDNQGFDAVL
jgi:Heavy-metal-associated domain.